MQHKPIVIKKIYIIYLIPIKHRRAAAATTTKKINTNPGIYERTREAFKRNIS